MPGMKNIISGLKPYIINKAKDGKSASVNLYGEIVESVPIDWWTGEKVDGLFIELKQFLSDIETLSEMDEVSFYINSVGGDVNAGTSIYSKIRGLKAHTTTVVDGLAASAASIVAQAGDYRKVSIGSQTMIHCASAGLMGYYNRDALKEVSNTLKSFDNSIAELLADRTGREAADILNMMNKTTWMTAEEAVKEGFADEVINKSEPVVDKVENTTTYIVNGIPHNFGGMPVPQFGAIGTYTPMGKVGAIMHQIGQWKDAVAGMVTVSNGSEPVDIENSPLKQEVKRMDINELKANYPDLVNQIEEAAKATAQTVTDEAVKNAVDEAVKAERQRMQEIDSIAQTVGAELVNEAKYGEHPMNASELALKALKNQQAQGAEYLNSRNAELESSNVNNVTAAPVSGSEEDTQTKDIEDGANLLLAAKK